MVLYFSNGFFGGLIFGEGQGTRVLINEGDGVLLVCTYIRTNIDH